ncbi:MAG: metallophosphoesterase family protein [Syntrophales bacterium]|nr:metallophosphoesterase family protein [Syntrophales bacterium]
MKIGVISDTHLKSYDDRLGIIMEDYFGDVGLILHAGDLVDISILDAFDGKEVKAVCGNMDPPEVKKLLPDKLVLDLNGYKVGLIHGWGIPFGIEKKLRKKFGDIDCLVYGHTHRAVNMVKDNVLFFNPGSAIDKRFSENNTIGILEISDKITGEIIELKY